MRYFIGCVALLLVYSGCSTTETIPQSEPERIETTSRPMIPSWYSAGVHFSSDSLALYGYSLASAIDSSRAVELATQSSLDYLRIEIDRTAEEIRKNLADSPNGDTYGSPSFIVRLRNAVSELSLDSVSFTRMHTISDSGVHYSHTRARLPQKALHNLFEKRLQDDRFLQQMENMSL